MADNDVDTGPITTLSAGGWIVIAKTVGGGSTMRFERVPAAGVAATLALASTALQPGALGAGASLSLAEINAMIDVKIDAYDAELLAVLGPQG